jgi:thymidylate synthase
MYTVEGRNVNSTYRESVRKIREVGLTSDSRNGGVLVANNPVLTVTTRPQERVLLDVGRDANPFFHFFECLWMLNGMNDARWLDRFVGNFSERFAESNGICHGAYGDRWKNWWSTTDVDWFDQLEMVIRLLRKNHLDRRAVLAMWSPERDLDASVNDVPCNTHIYPRITGRDQPGKGPSMVLDLTICCRSNDIIWGATGANAVHFSFLQEYMAGRIGVEVGTMYQLSNNWHAYNDTLQAVGIPNNRCLYESGDVTYHPIMNKPSEWDHDLGLFMQDPNHFWDYGNTFFGEVAKPMWNVHNLWRSGERQEAVARARDSIAASDWRMACVEWMERRL